ncbi:MAG TPA: hypothetical protein VI653_19620 [Steroidobacteraceae bacterium]
MSCTEVLKTRIPPDIKVEVKEIADRELLSEAAWLKRLVLREIRACNGTSGTGRDLCIPGRVQNRGREARVSGCARAMLVRLRNEDKLLLDARAEARAMRPATYASVLLRAHLRGLSPLPKHELAALKQAVGELRAVGRNLNQIARAVNQGARVDGLGRDEFRGLLKICEALRDHTKGVIKSNTASWATGYAEDTP